MTMESTTMTTPQYDGASATQTHWMSRVLDRAGHASAGQLVIPSGAPVARLWEIAMEASGLDADQLAAAVGATFRIDVADFRRASPTATKLLPASVARKFGIFPMRDEDRYLVVATSDPTNLAAEDEVGFASGRTAKLVIAPPVMVEDAITNAYSDDQLLESTLSDNVRGELAEILAQDSSEELGPSDVQSGPVIRLSNMILTEAISLGSSDIHIQPSVSGGVVRFRVDGVLRTAFAMPKAVYQRVISRIKIMGELDITDRLRPQDGRARVTLGDQPYDLRISTVPTQHAEKSVIRILDPNQTGRLDETGICQPTIEQIRNALSNREGIFIVTGPTGSGKTTTMYSALREIATESVNIMTVEDPIEYELEGLTQIPVDPKTGVTFASALRAVLRQDPDVIFVGEIRDEETARIAVQASMTGHLVLATLHTNDAVGTIHRFLDLGLDSAAITGTLKATLGQRLLRTICADCAEPVLGGLTPVEGTLAERYGVHPPVRARGCATCSGEGYRGRTPITEFMSVTPELMRLVTADAPSADLQAQAERDGMSTLLQSALDRVAAGETTLEEVDRVVGLANSGSQETESEALVESGPVSAPSVDYAPPSQETQAPLAATPTTAPIATHTASPTATPIATPAATPIAPPAVTTDTGVKRVLVVDDDGTNRVLARTLLEMEGYQVLEASDGSGALVLLARGERIDLMILDLDMPVLGGREVLASVRGAAATANLPVVVLTGTPDPQADIELLEHGADDYIRKPLDPARFMSRIKAALRRAQG